MPAFLTAKNLKQFISKELEVTSSQIRFLTIKGKPAFGYDAELLPGVCDVFIKADSAGRADPPASWRAGSDRLGALWFSS